MQSNSLSEPIRWTLLVALFCFALAAWASWVREPTVGLTLQALGLVVFALALPLDYLVRDPCLALSGSQAEIGGVDSDNHAENDVCDGDNS